MNKNQIDWIMVAIVSCIFFIAMFFGFGPTSKFQPSQDATGSFLVGIGLIIYGGAGLIRQRILFGACAGVLKGWWAILASFGFLGIGLFVLYDFMIWK